MGKDRSDRSIETADFLILGLESLNQAAIDRSGEGAPRRKLYGRSRGKTLRKYHADLIGELLPSLEIDVSGPIAPESLFESGFREIRLEIGFGGGERLLAQASANPDIAFIGCEPFVNGVAKLLAGIQIGGFSNVRIRSADAQSLLVQWPSNSFSRVDILYPDPWPKRRQNKRRFVSIESIAELARVIKLNGVVRFATDIDDYAGWTLGLFLMSPHFAWTVTRAQEWREPWSDWNTTRYESKAKREGRRPVYLTFQRTRSANLSDRPPEKPVPQSA